MVSAFSEAPPPPPPCKQHDEGPAALKQKSWPPAHAPPEGACERDAQARCEPQKGREWEYEGAAEDEEEPAAADLDGPDDRENLDSGYAWVILFVMFLLQSSISGSSRVYGIVYAKQVSIGYYDRQQASWPIATASAVENLASILTPALASFMSWRKIELLSTSLFISSNLLAYLSDSLTLDIIALGLVQGLALSTCTVLSLAINNDYFERYRTSAYGIQMSGSAFGLLYLSPLVSWLLEAYSSFRLVYLALAAVFCCNIFLVLFIKPRAKTIKRKRQTDAKSRLESGRPRGHKEEGETDEEETAAEAEEREIERQFERVKRVLESLDKAPAATAAAAAGEQQASSLSRRHSRKKSRFESHFERKNSLASISYEARSRRQSVLSRPSARLSPLGAQPASSARKPLPSSSSIYTTFADPNSNSNSIEGAGVGVDSSSELGCCCQCSSGELKNMIIKSKSGIELAGATFGGALADPKQQQPQQPPCQPAPQSPASRRRQRVSLNQMRSSPITMGAHHQLCPARLQQSGVNGAELSPSDSVKLKNTCGSAGGPAPNKQQTNLVRHSPLAGMSPELGRKLAPLELELDGGAPPLQSDTDELDRASFCGLKFKENNRSRANMLELDCASVASLHQHQQHQHQHQDWPLPAGANLLENCRHHRRLDRQYPAPTSPSTRAPSDGGVLARALELARSPYLHCTWLMLALYYLIARVFVIILVDFADDHAFSASESAYLLNYWALGELLGRLFLGPLIDLQYLSCRRCITLTCSLLAACIMCLVLFESYAIYAACSLSIAALISLEYMLINVLMVEYLGKEHVTQCYSLAACISSLVLFARPTLIGLFRDSLGSYDGLLILLAAFAFLFALLFHSLEPTLVRKWPKRALGRRH